MNDKEIESFNFFKLKAPRPPSPPPPPPPQPPSLILRNFKKLGKVLPNHAECFDI